MLRDTTPGLPLPEGTKLRGILPPLEGAGSDPTEVPDAKPPKAFQWVIGSYFS
jgi:hypothetical protein